MKTTVLIPAYKPSEGLVGLVSRLEASDVHSIVVVDDGSGHAFAPTFERVSRMDKVKVLRHSVNLGKGAALKTGINACLCDEPNHLIVTADADGQHLPEDILRVAEEGRTRRDALVLGSRAFEGKVPLRSRLGNEVTRHVLRAVLGYALHDTQTGLRALPAALAPQLLKLPSRGYEFELDMLIACKQLGVPIVQTRIQTVYLNENASSHFNPLLDSMRIYFALVRFIVASLGTALLDNLAFAAIYALTLSFPLMSTRTAVLVSQAGARAVAIVFNYAAGKRLVFASKQRHTRALPKYLLLVAFLGATSYMMITYLVEAFGLPVMVAKIVAEGILFVPSFVIQRDLVFRNRAQDEVGAADA